MSVSLDNLVVALQCLSTYRSRFKNVLKGVNNLYLAYFITACKKLAEYCQSWAKKQLAGDSHTLIMPSQLVSDLGLDQLPVRELDAWIRDTKIARKISGYAETLAERAASDKDCQSFIYQQKGQELGTHLFYS